MTNRFGSLLALILTLSFTLSSRADITILPMALRPHLNLPSATLPVQQSEEPFGQTLPSQSQSVLSVLDYVRDHMTHESIDDLEKANSGYNRRDDFGGWITDGNSCLDTRAKALVRDDDPKTPVKYRDERGCAVVKGLWHDPYAGDDYKLAKAIQIDHVVPLKHVYVTGGKDWAPEKRCYYANFLHNGFHLLSVAGHENMAKGDKAPDQYMPPNDAFQCQYVANWMKVKAIWQLIATEDEVQAIEKVIQTHHCSDSKFAMTEDEIQAERDAIENSIPAHCQDFAKNGAPRFQQLELPFPQN